jgi:hypothetical protein
VHFDEYPADLVRAVGLVVMSAAWTEDKAGELVQLVHSLANDRTREPAKGWAASGQQLIEVFSKVANTDLADRLRRALDFRNEVIHGVFIGGSVLPSWDSETGPEWVSMKRQFSKKGPAGIATVPWSVDSLLALAQEFTDLEHLIDDEISYAMGLKERPRSHSAVLRGNSGEGTDYVD